MYEDVTAKLVRANILTKVPKNTKKTLDMYQVNVGIKHSLARGLEEQGTTE